MLRFSFNASIAVGRGQRVNVLMRARPLRPGVFLLGRVITALAFSSLTPVILLPFGALVGGIRMDAITCLSLLIALLLDSIPFIALEMLSGYLAVPTQQRQ